MKRITDTLRVYINEAISQNGFTLPLREYTLSEPESSAHGQYATNVALTLSKEAGVSPKECAEKLVNTLLEKNHKEISKIEVAGPGFINIFLTDEVVREEIKRIESLSHFETKYSGKKVLVEHSSPNLFKPFHIGHLMNNIVGESIVRMMRATNAEVTTLSFPSDISLGIAKAIFIIKQDGGINFCKEKGDEIITYLGEAYVRGVAFYEEHKDKEQDIKDIAAKLYLGTPSEEWDIFEYAKKINIEYFLAITKSLGSEFDGLIYESEAGTVGEKVVKDNIGKVFTESEGAIVYIPEEERKDINTAVFINSQGHPTYEAKDLGLIELKFSKYSPDYSFFVTDTEQTSHFKVVLASLEKINSNDAEKSIHIPHGRMTFKGEKMSSRLGGVPLVTDILSVVEEEVKNKEGDKTKDFTEEEKKELYKNVSLAALRFAILRSKLGGNINFDPETTLSFEGDSGPYLQYTFARTQSLLAKGKDNGYSPQFSTPSLTIVEQKLMYFEGVVVRAIEEISPQHIVTYLIELAQEFNSFYGSTPIVVEGDETSAHRLAIVESVSKTLKRGLELLAIVAPNKM